MNTKKIAFFLQNLSGGGAEKSVVNLSNYLVNKGIEIDIVLVDKSSAAYLEELDFKIRVVDLNKKRSIKSIFAVKKYIRNYVLIYLIRIIVIKIFMKMIQRQLSIKSISRFSCFIKNI